MATSALHRWRQQTKKKNPNLWTTLATMVGTSPGYLDQIAYGNRIPSSHLALKLEVATKSLSPKGVKPVRKEALLFEMRA